MYDSQLPKKVSAKWHGMTFFQCCVLRSPPNGFCGQMTRMTERTVMVMQTSVVMK
jgi:hypothetical protein